MKLFIKNNFRKISYRKKKEYNFHKNRIYMILFKKSMNNIV